MASILLAPQEAAQRLLISERTLRDLKRKGLIRYVAVSARRIAYRPDDLGDCQEFCARGRLPSLDDEALTEDYGELTFGLTPFARWALPFVRRVIEHEI